MSSKATVKEFMDYSTFHGIGRTKNSPYFLMKVFWVLVLCGSFAMIIWQIHDLYNKYKSYPISTSVEVKAASVVEFPKVVICSTNPVNYNAFSYDSDLESVIKKASVENSIDMDIFNTSDIYGYNFTSYDQAHENKPIDHDILLKTAEQFKMYMSVLDDEALENISQPKDEFILLCNFAGEECSQEAITTLRTFHYGMCYMFDPTYQAAIAPHGKVSAVGPRYALEVLLFVDNDESVPFVTSSSGAAIGLQFDDLYFHKEHSVFVPTGFDTNIALSKVKRESVPGKKERKRCKESKSDIAAETLLDCMRDCKQKDLANFCGCWQFYFDVAVINSSVPLNETSDNETGMGPCYTETDYRCIQDRLTAYIKEPPELCSKCLSPCKEMFFERDISMTSWPDEKYLPILRRIMKSKVRDLSSSSIDRNFVRGNLALVRIYLSSLSFNYIKEEYTYSEVDFISDIGGQLGLWIGCSVLSMIEVVELLFLMIASIRPTKTSPGDQELSDKKEELKN